MFSNTGLPTYWTAGTASCKNVNPGFFDPRNTVSPGGYVPEF